MHSSQQHDTKHCLEVHVENGTFSWQSRIWAVCYTSCCACCQTISWPDQHWWNRRVQVLHRQWRMDKDDVGWNGTRSPSAGLHAWTGEVVVSHLEHSSGIAWWFLSPSLQVETDFSRCDPSPGKKNEQVRTKQLSNKERNSSIRLLL